jgi:hypothetical protein
MRCRAAAAAARARRPRDLVRGPPNRARPAAVSSLCALPLGRRYFPPLRLLVEPGRDPGERRVAVSGCPPPPPLAGARVGWLLPGAVLARSGCARAGGAGEGQACRQGTTWGIREGVLPSRALIDAVDVATAAVHGIDGSPRLEAWPAEIGRPRCRHAGAAHGATCPRSPGPRLAAGLCRAHRCEVAVSASAIWLLTATAVRGRLGPCCQPRRFSRQQ